MLSNLLKLILRGRKGAERWNRCKKCRNPIKGATNNAYFTAFLVHKYIIDHSACKLLYFLEKVQHLKIVSLIIIIIIAVVVVIVIIVVIIVIVKIIVNIVVIVIILISVHIIAIVIVFIVLLLLLLSSSSSVIKILTIF